MRKSPTGAHMKPGKLPRGKHDLNMRVRQDLYKRVKRDLHPRVRHDPHPRVKRDTPRISKRQPSPTYMRKLMSFLLLFAAPQCAVKTPFAPLLH